MPNWQLDAGHGYDKLRGPYVVLSVFAGAPAAMLSVERAERLRDDLDQHIRYARDLAKSDVA